MNEREEFLQYFQSVFPGMVERIGRMTESQALDGLSEVKAARGVYYAELAERFTTMTRPEVAEAPGEVKAAQSTSSQDFDFRNFVRKELRTLLAFSNSVSKLRSQLGGRARSGGSPLALFDMLEEALKQRLEKLRGHQR